jgi:hypothetical protein
MAQLAKDCKFILRSRKISAVSLLEAVLFSNPDHSKVSLNDLAIYHKLNYGINLTKQALDKRFSECATLFVKTLFAHLLKNNLALNNETFLHSCFNRIRIKDSLCFQLPENMKESYPGSGGAGSDAAGRIQFEYDLKNHNVIEFNISAFNNQDYKNARETLDNLQQDDLIIRDLGYNSIGVLDGICKRNAWFVSRLNHLVSVRDAETNNIIDFVEIEKQMCKRGILIMEKEVLLSQKDYRCRLVIEIVSDHIKEERIRKREILNKKKGRKSSKETLARAGLNLYCTNCPSQMISASEIRRIYGIRWQVEMIFKAWKQGTQLHTVKKMSVERFEFLIYAKMVWILLQWKIYQMIDTEMSLSRKGRVSVIKFYKAIGQYRYLIKMILKGQIPKMKECIKVLEEISSILLKHEDRKNRINWRCVEII